MSAESLCRQMSKDFKNYPTGEIFTSALLSEVVRFHPKNKAIVKTGRFRWYTNERNHNMRVLSFEESPGIWDTISWKKSAVLHDKQLKKQVKKYGYDYIKK